MTLIDLLPKDLLGVVEAFEVVPGTVNIEVGIDPN